MIERGYVSDAEWAWFKKFMLVCAVIVGVTFALILPWLPV